MGLTSPGPGVIGPPDVLFEEAFDQRCGRREVLGGLFEGMLIQVLRGTPLRGCAGHSEWSLGVRQPTVILLTPIMENYYLLNFIKCSEQVSTHPAIADVGDRSGKREVR